MARRVKIQCWGRAAWKHGSTAPRLSRHACFAKNCASRSASVSLTIAEMTLRRIISLCTRRFLRSHLSRWSSASAPQHSRLFAFDPSSNR